MAKPKETQSDLSKNKQPSNEQVDKQSVYDFLSKRYFWISLACLSMAVFFDCLPVPYCAPCVETFFAYTDYSPYVSTSLVIWTFGASLLIYFMGKMDDRCFGIRFHEALLAREERGRLLQKLGLFLAEIVFMEIAATRRLPISLFTVSMLQLLNIIFILLMVVMETSQDKVMATIQEQNKKVIAHLAEQAKGAVRMVGDELRQFEEGINSESESWLLIKALRGINYNRYEDMECLMTCLSPELWKPLDSNPGLQLLLSWKLGCLLLENGVTGEQAYITPALNTLFEAIAVNSEYSVEVKEGLLAALAVRGESPDCNERFWGMLNRMKDSHRGPIIDWSCGLLQDLVEGGICAWKAQFLYTLESCGTEYSCVPGHVLQPSQQELLTAFLDYLNGGPESGPDTGHTDSSTKEVAASHV